MNSIHPKPQLIYYDHNEKVTMLGGAAGFTLATATLMLFAATHIAVGVIGYSLFSAAAAVSLVSFVVGFVKLQQKRKKSCEQFLKDTAAYNALSYGQRAEPSQKEELRANPLVLETENAVVPSAEFIPIPCQPGVELSQLEALRLSLNPLIKKTASTVLHLAQAYYRSIHKPMEGMDEIKQGFRLLEEGVDKLLTDHTQLLRLALSIMSVSLVSQDKIKEICQKTDLLFLQELHSVVYSSNELYPQYRLYAQILRDLLSYTSNLPLTSQISKKIGTLRKHLQQLVNQNKAKAKENKIEELNNNYHRSLEDLFDLLFLSINLEARQTQEWSEQIISTFLDQINFDSFKSNIDEAFVYASSAFAENGYFNQNWVTTIVYGVTSRAGRAALVLPLIKKGIAPLPLSSIYKETLHKALEVLVTALSNPIYYGTCEKQHPFRRALADFVCSGDFRSPSFPPMQANEKNWSFCLTVVEKFLQDISTVLDNFRFQTR